MVDRDIVARRLLALSEALQGLASYPAGDAAALIKDPLLRAAVERWLQVAIESCVDVAYHVVADAGWTPSESARGAFQTLAAHGLLVAELGERLGRTAALRNSWSKSTWRST